jgi:hypothetical protein
MTTPCLSIDEIARLADADADAGDPGRRHIDTCARCAALAVEYTEFLRARPGMGADVGDARRRLQAFITERIERDPVAAATRRPPRRWFELSPRRSLLLAASVAAAVLVFAVARWQPAPDAVHLRGATDESLMLGAHTVAANKSVVLSWEAVAGADGYRLTILGPDLSERVVAPVTATSLEFVPARFALEPGAYYWEITALAQGDAIASSTPVPLHVVGPIE